MPKAISRLEILQIRKLLCSLQKYDTEQIKKLLYHGLPYLIDLGEPEKGITPLIHCIHNNNLKTLRALLQLGARVNEADNEGATPIMHAAKLGNFKAFQILQDFNANTNIVDNQSVLFYCASASDSHADCLKLALESKVDVDLQDINGCTALNEACKSAVFNEQICKLLLIANANPNIPSNSGRTPLMEACKSGSGKVVSMLARRNADLEAKDRMHRTAIFDAASGGFVDTLVALSAFGANFDYDKKDNNPMHLAAMGNPLSCRFLGQRGCNGKSKNVNGDLPRTIATDEGFKECVKEIKKTEKLFGKVVKNAEPWALKLYDFMIVHNNELSERLKNTAQEEAIYRQKQVLEAELAAKALEEGQTGETSTMLGSAMSVASSAGSIKSSKSKSGKKKKKRKKSNRASSVKSGKVEEEPLPDPVDRLTCEVVFSILKSLDAPLDEDSESVLRILHDKNKDNTIDWKEFLSGKKFVNKNYLMSAYEPKQKKKKKGKGKAKKPGKNPLDICEIPKEQILRRLDGGPPIMYIPKFDNFTDAERFDEEAPVHPLQDDSKWYLEAEPRRFIHINEAAKYGDLASIQLALAEGYAVDTRDKWYKTPLMIAAQFGHLEMVKYLLQFGADVNAQDNFKWTPLHHAAHGGMIDVVEMLLKHGALLEAKALNQGTPLNRAIETSRYNVVDYLVRCGAKILSENKKGNTIVDNSFYWSDPRVIDLLQEKYQALPASQKDKKETGAKGKTGARKPSKRGSQSQMKQESNVLPGLPPLHQRIGGSKQQNLFAGLPKVMLNVSMLDQVVEKDDPLYMLTEEWKARESIKEKLQRRVQERMRYGWDVHLPDIRHNFFEKNIERLAAEVQNE